MEKKYLKIGLILVFCLILIFVLTKIFRKAPQPELKPEVLTLPPEVLPGSPEEVAIKYLWEEQRGEKGEAEKYLYPNFYLVKIFDQYYSDVRWTFFPPERREGKQPEFKIIKSQIGENEGVIVVEEVPERNAGNIFFGFPLPEKIVFEISLTKFGDQWKIIRVDSPDLISRVKIGEKAEIKKGIFVTLIKIEDSTLEIEYENKSNEAFNYRPFDEWKIIGWDGKIYTPIQNIKEPTFPEGKLDPGDIEKSYLSFKLPEEITIKEIIFRIPQKKIVFQIPVEIPPVMPEEEL